MSTIYDSGLDVSAVATHHDCRLFYGGLCFARLSEAVGKPEEKSPATRARDQLFNEGVGRVWLRRMRSGGTRFNDYLGAAVAAKRRGEKKKPKDLF